MDNTLKEILENEVHFLKPYIFQFKKRLSGNNIKLIENEPSNIKNILKELDLVETNKNINGVIIYELNEETINILNTKISNEIDDSGKILIINSNNNYQKEVISYLLNKQYELEEELIGDSKWNFLLYKKNTTQ